MSTDRTLLERASQQERQDLEHTPTDPDPDLLADTASITARSTTIGGEPVDLSEPRTTITFNDESGLLSGEKGRPRPRAFWHAKQLGQTPPMELIKITVTQQLTGGQPQAVSMDGEGLEGALADIASLVEDVYRGPHFQELSFDNLITATVSDLVDLAWAYWEALDAQAENVDFPVAFKPLPPLQIQHNVSEDTGALQEEPAFYQVPFKRQGGTITTDSEAVSLDRGQVVVMRDPQSSRSNSLYGESIATKVREYIELIVDVDVHQKRHYADSELPAGFLHFIGNVGEDDLVEVEQDIVEAAGDPHELVTTTSEGDVSWIPVGESVVDLDAIQEQQWYFKLVFAAAGLNLNELGVIEGSGFAKETPALARQVFKKVTKPMLGAIMDPQNQQVLPQILEEAPGDVDTADLRLELERFDPVQEQVEREETIEHYTVGGLSLNELRGGFGREATEFEADVGGETVNLADVPKAFLDLLKPDLPTLGAEDVSGGEASSGRGEGPPDFDSDPVVSEREAFETLDVGYSPQVVRQLEDTIEVQSSFIESVAYARPTQFLQIEFERTGSNAVYWYGSVPEYRFHNLLRASSKGGYFNRYIRHTGDPGYPYARVA